MKNTRLKTRIAWSHWVGLGLLVICYLAALTNVFRMKKEELSHDVVRIVHWQLELGVRDGISELIRLFEEKKSIEGHPVKVVQIPMPEGAYKQYVTTQMIGGTPPDLVELGFFPSEFYGRYFLPLSDVIARPNPLVAARLPELSEADPLIPLYESLRDVAWMETFRDGLRTQFNSEAQEYFGVGFSQFTVRMFYNKDIIRAAVGSDEPPRSFQDLLHYGDKIISYGESIGRPIYPIASSKYQMGIFKGSYLTALTSDLVRENDMDLDGHNSREETSAAILTGAWGPRDPQYEAAIKSVKRLTEYFPPGFMSLGRMDSGFSFVQGRAAMITSGSWDARSFLKKIQDQPEDMRFEVGIFDIPIPTKNHPEFGPFVDGRASESNTGTSFSFGISRQSRNADLCIEFLQFCTLPENNDILNRHAEWIPSVRGATPTDMLKFFQPNFAGYWGRMEFDTGARGQLVSDQVFWPFISGEIDYDRYAEDLMDQLPSQAALDWARFYREAEDSMPNRLARRSAYLAAAELSGDEPFGRAEAIQLLRSWENLIAHSLRPAQMDQMMNTVLQTLDETGYDSEYNREFFSQLKREMN